MPYHHINAGERYVIFMLSQIDVPQVEIARRLGRSPATISREWHRGCDELGRYNDWLADEQARHRRHQARHRRRADYSMLVAYVKAKLQAYWPPEAIAARLRLDYPDQAAMRISPEQIYQWVFADAQRGGDLYTLLRRAHKRRRRQGRVARAKRGIVDAISIDQRPAAVAARRRFGDWEGDTIAGRQSTGLIATHVERKSGFLVAAKLDRKQAHTVAQATIAAFERLPQHLRRTMTYDNGREFAAFKHIQQATGLMVYFAHPYAPWQRGCNENANGLLRQFFPKGCDLRQVDQHHVDTAVQSLNNRPRKRLGYRTPSEVLRLKRAVALAS